MLRAGLLVWLWLLAPWAWAGAEREPAAVVGGFQVSLLDTMARAGTLGYAGRFRALAPAVRASHDLAAISRIAAGRHWHALSPEQQALLVDTFAELSIGTYAYRFDNYAGQRFRVESTERPAADQALVRTRFMKVDGSSVGFDYVLHRTAEGWRIVNIIVDGVSDLALRRAEFGSILRRDGFEALIRKLRDKIAEFSAG